MPPCDTLHTHTHALYDQVLKSMAAVEEGEALFNKYSTVSEEDGGWLTLRDIVLSRKMPRRMLVQPLTVIEGTILF